MVFARRGKQRTIPFFTVYGWWELKLRYCPVKVGLRYTDDLNPCSVRVTNTSGKGNLLSCSFSLKVQSRQQASNNKGIPNTCTRLLLTGQATPVDSIKDVARSSKKVPEFDKHLKKTGGHISRNVVEIMIKMKTIVRKPLMIKIIKLRLRN